MDSLIRLRTSRLRTGLITCLLAGAIRSAGAAAEPMPNALLMRGESKSLQGAGFDLENLEKVLKSRLHLGTQSGSTDQSKEFARVLTKWSNDNRKAGEGDQACRVVYYRGAFGLQPDGNLALCLDDSNSRTPIDSLLQPLSGVAAKHPVLLILDTTSRLDAKVLQQSIAKALKNAPQELGVIVIEQKRTLWRDRSLANFRLCHGLAGRADANGDGRVTFRELTDFVAGHFGESDVVVTRVPEALKSNSVATVQPPTLDELLEDLADGLALEFHDDKTKVVAVPEFEYAGRISENGKLPGQPYGPLTRYCLAKLKRELALRSGFLFSIVDDERLRNCLNANDLGPENVQSPALRKVGESIRMGAKNGENAPVAVILGTIEERSADAIAISLTPWDTASGAAAATISGRARITASEWAMLGRSAVNKPALFHFVSAPQVAPLAPKEKPAPVKLPGHNERPPVPANFEHGTDNAEAARQAEIKEFEKSSYGKHPSLDPTINFPFSVKIAVERAAGDGRITYDDLPQQQSADAREVYVELNKGQNYVIRVENTGLKGAFMRLLVDGLNTLPDVPMTRRSEQYEDAPQDGGKDSLPAQIVSLNTARPWYCEPNVKSEVRGFFTHMPEGSKAVQATLQKFEVTDASDSEAARKKYLKDVGIVTAAFYAPGPRPVSMGAGQRTLGTKLGAARNETVQRYEGNEFPCELLGVVHIRYGVRPVPNRVTQR